MTNSVCKRALETWGETAQMLMVIEEMSELTKEILKNVNRRQNNIADIIEETAYVEIMLEQLKENYHIAQQVEEYIAQKLMQIATRLDKWKKAE